MNTTNKSNDDLDDLVRVFQNSCGLESHGKNLNVEYYPEINASLESKARKKIAPSIGDDEKLIAIIDTVGKSLLWNFFKSPGSEGIVITSKALYDNISFFFYGVEQIRPIRLPWTEIYTISYQALQHEGPKKILINGVPLWGIEDYFNEPPEEFISRLFEAINIAHSRFMRQGSPSLAEVVASFANFGLAPADPSESVYEQGLKKANVHYKEFSHTQEIILFQWYQPKSFWENEEQFLVTDKHIFCYADWIDKEHYQVWELTSIRDIALKMTVRGGSEYSREYRFWLYLNGAMLVSPMDSLSKERSREELIHRCTRLYLVAAMLSTLVKITNDQNLSPVVNLSGDEDDNTGREILGPLKKLQ